MQSERPAPATLEDALGLLGQVWEELGHLRAENTRLQARVQELEARLRQNSSNSSRPPSSDPPAAPGRRPPPPSGRRRGGQPGHPPHERPRLPLAQVDHIVDHWPERCGHCQAALAPAPAPGGGEPTRHQVTELPPVRAAVTEHRLHQGRCPACGELTRARLPAAVPPGAFGPRLQAAVALLSSRYRLSRRAVVSRCTDLLGAPLAVGSVDGLCRATAAVLAEPLAELPAAVQSAPAVHGDETGWRPAGQRRWLWVVVAPLVTVFAVAASRSSQVIKELLGETFGGYLISDRWSAYTWLAPDRRQVCWAHLKRDFQALEDYGGAGAAVGREALALLDRLFDAWYRVRAEPAQWPGFAAAVQPVQAEFRALLETGQDNRDWKAAGLCRALLKLWPALWTFVTVPGVEPTNNAAERALRPAVLWRQGSFGTRSDGGALFVARLLSVAATCQQQERSLLEYLTAVCRAAQQGHPIPSLLPSPPAAQAA